MSDKFVKIDSALLESVKLELAKDLGHILNYQSSVSHILREYLKGRKKK